MIRVSAVIVGFALLLGALGCAAQDTGKDKAAKETAEPYPGFKSDQALLRKQMTLKGQNSGKDLRVSSAEAIDAAQRILSRVSFLFRSREDILNLLGDPATISDYGKGAGKDPFSPLVYVFDTGLGGLTFTISFEEGRTRANQVRVDFLD